MRSVADDVARDDRRAARALTAAQRVRRALSLGMRDIATLCAARGAGLSARDAARIFERQRQVGRRPSRCHAEIIG